MIATPFSTKPMEDKEVNEGRKEKELKKKDSL